MTDKLINKKVLLLAPSFFSYEIKIKEKMEQMGAVVYLYDERSVNSALSRAVLKIVPSVFSFKTKKYYKKIISDNRNIDFDYVLVIRCDMISRKIMKLLRSAYSKAKFCLYLYDSKKNIKGIESKISLFDFAYSFDLKDCEEDKRLKFRPLFYTDDFVSSQSKKKYDLCFCGTIHSDRYKVLKNIVEEANKNSLTYYIFAYLPGKFMFCFYKLFAKGFKNAKMNDFSFSKLDLKNISLIENQSSVVIDIHHPAQTGLTMRTIEMIGSRKKFITTNSDIKKYDFYNPNNILIVDRNNPKISLDFFDKEYDDIPLEIYEKYNLENWICDVLCLK